MKSKTKWIVIPVSFFVISVTILVCSLGSWWAVFWGATIVPLSTGLLVFAIIDKKLFKWFFDWMNSD